MIIHGFESEPSPCFSEEREWKAYQAMSGCQQAAHRAKLCWAAMLAAAPKSSHIRENANSSTEDFRENAETSTITPVDKWREEAERMAELHGTSFVVFRNGEEPQCADPMKVVISFTDKGLGHDIKSDSCWCHSCRPLTMHDMRFVVCPDCGNKRCPKANDHRHACSESNEPRQEGSAYGIEK